MRIINSLLLSVAAVGAAFSMAAAEADLAVKELRCEYGTDPLGIDSAAPRLFWQLESGTRGQCQTAYRILAASSAELLARDRGDLWDSGKIKSGESTHIAYAGKPLKSSQPVFWKVRAWDKDGRQSPWSSSASWTMGILAEAEWQANWIGFVAKTNSNRQWIGYHAAQTPQEDEVKWVQVDLGRVVPLTAIHLQPMQHAGRKGFGFPLRFKIEVAADPEFKEPVLITDQTAADYPNPGAQTVSFDARNTPARAIRVTATKLWKRDTVYSFALCQLDAMSGGTNVAKGGKVTAKDTVENYGWGLASLTDGRCGEKMAKSEPQTLLLRREFKVKPGLRRAVLHTCGLGCYELSLNGRKVGETLFPPGWTKYDRTCLYDTYEVTSLVREGPNAVGLVLGNGMYNVTGGRYTKFTGSFGLPKAIAHLRLEYADGAIEVMGTDDTWRRLPGPITMACVFGGEDYDAQLEPPRWSEAGFDDSAWERAEVVKSPGGALKGFSCAAPPIQTFEILKPVQVRPLRPGVSVYDLGQNVSLMPRLRVRGPAGAIVRMIPAELLGADGAVDRGSCAHGRPAYWQYTLAGGASESWFPKFYYHGCRYLQVECQAPAGGELPVVEALEGLVVHSASPAVGEFECSNPLFNRIRTLVRWAQRSNMMSVLTDCPHREKLGWLEEDHLNGPSLRYEFDLAQLFTKAMNDMADSQLENGLVPDIAPEYVQFTGGFRDSPEWGSAYVLVPWQQYEFTGDRELLRRHFQGMQRYVAYLTSRATDHIVSHGLGDWYDIGPKPPGVAQLTPLPLTATAFYYYDTWILAQAAALLGRSEEAKQYRQLAEQIGAAFNRAFYDAGKGQYATGSQCANSIPLVMGLVEPKEREKVLENVVRDVRTRGNALTAGDVGYRYLLRALAEGGRSDVIFDINNQSEKPGYGYQLRQGATSLTEAWDANPKSSQNHFMLGQITEWFYHDLAGIASDPAGPGFKKIRIRPAVVGDLTWVKGHYRSIHGPISSQWRREGNEFSLRVEIPANTDATVYVPAASGESITEGGQPVASARHVKLLRQERGYAVFGVGSGVYEFRVQGQAKAAH